MEKEIKVKSGGLFQLFPRDVLLYVAKKLADKDLGALRCDRWLDERISPAFHRRISDSLTVEAVAAGRYHSLVLLKNGQLLACGDNAYGQLGLSDTQNRKSWTPVAGLNDAILQISAGGHHTLLLTTNGQLFACGENHLGHLGLGDAQDRDTLTLIEGLKEPVRWVMSGANHTLACTQAGRLLVCGRNKRGQLGLGDTQDRHTFTPIKGLLEPIAKGAVGGAHTELLTTSGYVTACGWNQNGQLGVGDRVSRTTWASLEGINEPIEQVAAGRSHTLALLRDGRLMVCGSNYYGKLGLNGAESRDTLTPVVGLPEAVFVEAGFNNSLVVTTCGQLFVCGENSHGQLGLGDHKTRRVFTHAQRLTPPLSQVSARGHHTLAITQSGQLLVCGRNQYGQLGLGDTKGRNEFTPAQLHPKGFLSDWHTLIAKRKKVKESGSSEPEQSDGKTTITKGM